jgi:hypothetical protein
MYIVFSAFTSRPFSLLATAKASGGSPPPPLFRTCVFTQCIKHDQHKSEADAYILIPSPSGLHEAS